ncbi:Oidioi.mRNA.OKI2018_I69.chr1.g1444.t1.cds [Oikopleura dioica]|uniref:Oidioi.mRNA.OKI2018_I69.chr1.g1444.t1.cds n=1 Tax=Oikopleura dioica TaxID=34765 RepID=A0ABN7SMY1_OIKDI|nr:Oidioi.mRNA.OKI2018_I69.chr1.g1444.t1.cds [Oikopleura dioica]
MDYRINMFLRQRWTDPRLRHNVRGDPIAPDATYLDKIWVPDLFFNNEKSSRFHDITLKNKLVRISREGEVVYSMRITLVLSSPMSLTKFPMDTQEIYMQLECFSVTNREIDFEWDEKKEGGPFQFNEIVLSDFSFDPKGILLGQCDKNYESGTFSCIEAKFVVTRQLGYYIINIFIPTLLGVVLSYMSYWIDPRNSPARICIGVFANLGVNTVATSGSLPKVSYIKAIDVWFFACQILTFICLVEYAKVNVYIRDHKFREQQIEIARKKYDALIQEEESQEDPDDWLFEIIGEEPPRKKTELPEFRYDELPPVPDAEWLDEKFRLWIPILLTLFGLLVRAQQCSSGVKDLTMTPGSTGEDVARATYGKVWAEISTWDPKYVDRDFFVRYAYTESIIEHQYVQQIWPIDEQQFNSTKNSGMKSAVSTTFNVDWDVLEYDELTIPTYSMLALFLHLDDLNYFPIPFSIDAQGAIFENITHHTVDGFKDATDELDLITESECLTKALDIVFVVDQSGGGTNTADAIDAALLDFGADRPESAKFMVTITDGASNSFAATKAAADRVKANSKNIQSFAIGVAGAREDELEAIATSLDHVEMLDGFGDFEPIKKNLLSKICTGNIENNNGGDTQIGGSTGTPGKITYKIGMTGKDNFDVKASGPLTFFYHRSNPQPGPAAYQKMFNATSSNLNTWINHNVGSGHSFVYLSAYNYRPSKAIVSLQIKSGGSSVPLDPEPVMCSANAYCDGGTCECFPQYSLDGSGNCVFDRCANVDCFNGYQCAEATGTCFCPDDHLQLDGNCYPATCPDSVVKVHENEFGNAMGELSSPWREHAVDYPSNFNCTYEFETVRAEGSCYEVLLEKPFGIEASANCQNDRLEIFDVLNADQVNMDHSSTRPAGAAVMCGDACIAEGGWVGKICGDKLKIRFKTDHIAEDIGWKLKWVLRPKEECDCLCNRP